MLENEKVINNALSELKKAFRKCYRKEKQYSQNIESAYSAVAHANNNQLGTTTSLNTTQSIIEYTSSNNQMKSLAGLQTDLTNYNNLFNNQQSTYKIAVDSILKVIDSIVGLKPALQVIYLKKLHKTIDVGIKPLNKYGYCTEFEKIKDEIDNIVQTIKESPDYKEHMLETIGTIVTLKTKIATDSAEITNVENRLREKIHREIGRVQLRSQIEMWNNENSSPGHVGNIINILSKDDPKGEFGQALKEIMGNGEYQQTVYELRKALRIVELNNVGPNILYSAAQVTIKAIEEYKNIESLTKAINSFCDKLEAIGYYNTAAIMRTIVEAIDTLENPKDKSPNSLNAALDRMVSRAHIDILLSKMANTIDKIVDTTETKLSNDQTIANQLLKELINATRAFDKLSPTNNNESQPIENNTHLVTPQPYTKIRNRQTMRRLSAYSSKIVRQTERIRAEKLQQANSSYSDDQQKLLKMNKSKIERRLERLTKGNSAQLQGNQDEYLEGYSDGSTSNAQSNESSLSFFVYLNTLSGIKFYNFLIEFINQREAQGITEDLKKDIIDFLKLCKFDSITPFVANTTLFNYYDKFPELAKKVKSDFPNCQEDKNQFKFAALYWIIKFYNLSDALETKDSLLYMINEAINYCAKTQHTEGRTRSR